MKQGVKRVTNGGVRQQHSISGRVRLISAIAHIEPGGRVLDGRHRQYSAWHQLS